MRSAMGGGRGGGNRCRRFRRGICTAAARLPFRAIQSYLATLHALQLSVGELVELTHDVRQQLQPQADQLKAQVQTSPVAHGDETGWRENGQNGYAWAFVTAGPHAACNPTPEEKACGIMLCKLTKETIDKRIRLCYIDSVNRVDGFHKQLSGRLRRR